MPDPSLLQQGDEYEYGFFILLSQDIGIRISMTIIFGRNTQLIEEARHDHAQFSI